MRCINEPWAPSRIIKDMVRHIDDDDDDEEDDDDDDGGRYFRESFLI